MLAGDRRPAPPGPAGPPTPRDAGYTLVELIVAISLIGIVMAALTAFYVRSVAVTQHQGSRQVAIQFALDGIDEVRALRGTQVTDELARRPAPDRKTFNGLEYTRTFEAVPCWQPAGRTPANSTCLPARPVGAADSAYAELVRVGVTVTWDDKDCTDSRCTHTDTTLVSSSADDPVFRKGTS